MALLSLLSSAIFFVKFKILTFNLRQFHLLNWIVIPLSLGGLEKLIQGLITSGYPMYSEAFLLEGTIFQSILKFGGYISATWLYYLLILPFIYWLERLYTYNEFLEIREKIKSVLPGKIGEVLELIVRGDKLRLSSLAWLLRGITFIALGSLILYHYNTPLKVISVQGRDQVEVTLALPQGELSLRGVDANLRSWTSLISFLRGQGAGSLIISPESTYIGEIPASPKLSGEITAENLKLESIAVIGGVFKLQGDKFQGERYTGALIVKLRGGEIEDLALQVKRKLVPFGEYLPRGFQALVPPKVKELIGRYSPGSDNLKVRLGDLKGEVLICSEAFFPQLVSEADLVIVLSNTSWYRGSSIEHFYLKALRLLSIWKNVTVISVIRDKSDIGDASELKLVVIYPSK